MKTELVAVIGNHPSPVLSHITRKVHWSKIGMDFSREVVLELIIKHYHNDSYIPLEAQDRITTISAERTVFRNAQGQVVPCTIPNPNWDENDPESPIEIDNPDFATAIDSINFFEAAVNAYMSEDCNFERALEHIFQQEVSLHENQGKFGPSLYARQI
jgi:hypothetical protein